MKKLILSLITSLILLAGCGTSTTTFSEQATTDNKEETEEQTEQVKENQQDDEPGANTSDSDIEKDAPEDKQQLPKEGDDEKAPLPKGDIEPMRVHFIDVGQGDATLIESGDYTILFDAGNWNNRDAVDYLHSQGITQLDLVIASHPDADHIGQLPLIFNELSVGEVWMNGVESTSRTFERTIELILEQQLNYHEPSVGEEAQLGDLAIEVIAPVNRKNDANADSLAIKLSHGKIDLLLTGDAGIASEQAMVDHFNVRSEFLQLGHHGSNTSSSLLFLQAVQPDIAVISVGANNSYGHPHPDVLERLTQLGTTVYLTSRHGSIVFESTGDRYQLVKLDNKITSTNSRAPDGEQVSESKQTEATSPLPNTDETITTEACVDINHASLEALATIKHIGEVRAEALVNLRPFESVDDLSRIKGIGPSRLEDIKAENKACVR